MVRKVDMKIVKLYNKTNENGGIKVKENKALEEKINHCLNCKNMPCSLGCPLNNKIPIIIHLLKEGKEKEAYKTLSETTMLGGICGRICPHYKQCQGKCIRGIKSVPVSIGEVEAYIWDLNKNTEFSMISEELKGKNVAVVGGGPAGLTCAGFLKRNGADVTIYEKYDRLGGILVHGIPEFRLDKDVVNECINRIIRLGINVELNTELGKNINLDELSKKYDAVFLGFGANKSSKMNTIGEELEGVIGGNELLESGDYPDFKGKKVAIIGGGNVAMDTARKVKRLGALEVNVIYRRAEKQMPAEEKEIEDAKKEGVNFLFQNNIVRIIGDNKVEKLECIKTELVKKEGETREVPVNIEGSNYVIDLDYVISATGSRPESEILQKLNIDLNEYGYIKINENMQTSNEKIFAGGDVAGVKSTVAWAARSGRDAADNIRKFLK